MVKGVLKALDSIVSMFIGMLVVLAILLALTGHLDLTFSQGLRSYGMCYTFIK